ncbi:acyl-CoA dehydratase activase-related protein [Bacteroidota bacterium]
MNNTIFKTGIDVGSTTAKIVILDPGNKILYSDYRRHLGSVSKSMIEMCHNLKNELGDIHISLAVTGSAGMGISEKNNFTFVQELIASTDYLSQYYPESKTFIDIGGEDSKIIFFNEDSGHDLRMNSSCAGGTGAFIDQMASLLDVSLTEFDHLASLHREIYSIASRCGVFAKTDVQDLISREIPREDICASIYDAVALQIKNSLLRGKTANPKIVLAGGPLTFLPNMRRSLIKLFDIHETDILDIENPEFIPSIGAAITDSEKRTEITLDNLISSMIKSEKINIVSDNSIEPLFKNKEEFAEWNEFKSSTKAPRVELKDLNGSECFLGIDSGSTTTKLVLVDDKGNIAFDYYKNNGKNSIGAVRQGLAELKKKIEESNVSIKIISSAVTGYGEDLIKSAFNINYGIVETIAHYRAAKEFDDNVSFILDIGGQDMKAIFIRDGIIQNIEINEACSSGCGSFIETFAGSLDYSVEKFAQIACEAETPCDLGTRCTVFMNSKVKQSYRQGSTVSDISAGLAYSVIQNCLHKVLKIYDSRILGDNIIVQGGTFKNEAIHRAFENISGRKVVCPDISELMGAYGAAIIAREMNGTVDKDITMPELRNEKKASELFNLNTIDDSAAYSIKYVNCKGCENYCKISKLTFKNGNIFYTGNRCENVFTNRGEEVQKGENLIDFKYKLLFDRDLQPNTDTNLNFITPMTVGIPRVLNIFENFPFWHKLFTECGIEIKLSDIPNRENCYSGSGTVMSDNVCYPAKLVHGHIMNLISQKVDRIFYPIVNFEKKEFDEMTNCFNCPVVTGYPDVIRSSMNPKENYGIEFDTPNINFKDENLLSKACFRYLGQFGISKKSFNIAFKAATEEHRKFKEELRTKALEILIKATLHNRKVFVLALHPYQIDPDVNHGIPKIFTDFGFDVITEDSLPYTEDDRIDNLNVLSQWTYPNRLFKAAQWSLKYDNIEFVQLNSFGCGPDTVVIDEIKEIMEEHSKNHAVLRIDEQSAPGSFRLRIRSLVESIKLRDKNIKDKNQNTIGQKTPRLTTRPFTESDKDRLILVPFFSQFHSAYASAAFLSMGYKVEQLPESNQDSIDLGLKFANNEICYPATLIIGDFLKALKSGKYDNSKIAIGISQTGGQCRASNYLPLIKKALVKNGYHNIPVIGVTLSNQKLNHQPGFKLKKAKFTSKAMMGLLFGDAISRMYYALTPREKNKGDAKKLAEKYAGIAQLVITNSNRKSLLDTLKLAVGEFNNIEVIREQVPKVGIVGEVYVKYNSIGNNHTVSYLLEHSIEPVMPPLVNMFTQWFVNINVKNEELLDHRPVARQLTNWLEIYYNKIDNEFELAMKIFKYNIPKHSIHSLANNAKGVVNLGTHYFGEGWLIAGDILAFAKDGIHNVLCLQPFGCLANHVVARGIEKKLKEIEPKLNVLFLDIDAGVSHVNLHNRLYLLIKNAERELKNKKTEDVISKII